VAEKAAKKKAAKRKMTTNIRLVAAYRTYLAPQ
jgi:hypothetical protein